MNKLTKSIRTPLYKCTTPSRLWTRQKRRNNGRFDASPYYSGNHSSDNDYTKSNDCSAQTTVAKSDAKDGEVAFERINGNNITKVKITFKDGLIQKMTTDSIIDFDISGLPETSKEAFKQALQTQKQTMEQSYNQLKEQIKDVTGLKLDIRMEGTKYIQSYEVDYSNVNFDQLREIDPDFTSKEEATNYDEIIQSLLDAGFTRVN